MQGREGRKREANNVIEIYPQFSYFVLRLESGHLPTFCPVYCLFVGSNLDQVADTTTALLNTPINNIIQPNIIQPQLVLVLLRFGRRCWLLLLFLRELQGLEVFEFRKLGEWHFMIVSALALQCRKSFLDLLLDPFSLSSLLLGHVGRNHRGYFLFFGLDLRRWSVR